MDFGLHDKVVIVTGASSGIGRATARAFADAGARVVATYLRHEEGARETAARAAGGAGEIRIAPLDQSDLSSIEDLVTGTAASWGGIDVLVNNAVAWPPWPAPAERFETAPPDRFTDSTAANLTGPYLLSRAAVGYMRAKGWGRIVHVSTGLVEDGFPANASYVAAKAGLHGLARSMSRELASAGILTNVVMPGFTPGGKQIPTALRAKAAAAAATGRVTEPDEVARVIVFLCSAANTIITGELIRADGHFLSPV